MEEKKYYFDGVTWCCYLLLYAIYTGNSKKKLMKFLICARSNMMGHLEDAESASCPYTLTSITHGVLDS
jgi:hypothetical protein